MSWFGWFRVRSRIKENRNIREKQNFSKNIQVVGPTILSKYFQKFTFSLIKYLRNEAAEFEYYKTLR